MRLVGLVSVAALLVFRATASAPAPGAEEWCSIAQHATSSACRPRPTSCKVGPAGAALGREDLRDHSRSASVRRLREGRSRGVGHAEAAACTMSTGCSSPCSAPLTTTPHLDTQTHRHSRPYQPLGTPDT